MRSAFGLVDGDTDVIASAAARVTTLVRSLKNFARLDESEFQRADIREGIDSALDLLGHVRSVGFSTFGTKLAPSIVSSLSTSSSH